MTVPFVDLKSQYLGIKDQIDAAIEDVIMNTMFIGGKPVADFKEKFEKVYGTKHCIPVANGTDAIYIVLRMLGIGEGDEVITAANSWISTSETISQTGAKPVFVDVDEYYTIDVDQIESKITDKTKAIIPVHLTGQMADVEKVGELCSKYGLHMIEDTAQAHFSELKGKRAGTWGIAATFSFYPGKNLGAYGDAGCIITEDAALAEKCKMFANHGALKKHHHKMEGINSRLDGMQAAVLNVKLDHILDWTESRRQNAAYYTSQFEKAGISSVELPKLRPDSKHSYHLYIIKTEKRDELQAHLTEKGIGTAIHYPTPLPFMEAYSYLGHTEEEFPVCRKNQDEILSLPMYPELTKEQMDYVVETIDQFFNEA